MGRRQRRADDGSDAISRMIYDYFSKADEPHDRIRVIRLIRVP